MRKTIVISICLVMILAAVMMAAVGPAYAEGTEWACPVCGTGNTSRYCTHCGQLRPGTVFCPACGRGYPDDPAILFCGDCGTRLREETGASSEIEAAELTELPAAAEKPEPPEASPTPAYYEKEQYITLTSPQGYAIFYTLRPDGELPYIGTAYAGPFELEEGTYTVRAVCVDRDRLSDEARFTYKIVYPAPGMPRASLAPNTYKARQKVRLKPAAADADDGDITIYYTIDGSMPDKDSPIYNGEAIELPTGRVTLRAVAVNRYGKVSNMLEVGYKIDAAPRPRAVFSDEDMPNGIMPGVTGEAEFFEVYGEGRPAGPAEDGDYPGECLRYEYSWGYVVTGIVKDRRVVAEIGITAEGPVRGPRMTGIGDHGIAVTDKFRDAGQVANYRNDRGLYENDKGSGKILQQEDDTQIIRYRYMDGECRVELAYYLTYERVDRIVVKYIP